MVIEREERGGAAGSVFLVGFMGVGKSAVGRRLAEILGMPFVDLDSEVEALAGRSIAEIFETEGEAPFRELERRCLEALEQARVVALGGGTFLSEENRELLARAGTTVWLDVPWRTILSRLSPEEVGRRPLFRDPDQARALFRERLPVYRRAAIRIEVHGAQTPEQVAARIARQLRGEPCAI